MQLLDGLAIPQWKGTHEEDIHNLFIFVYHDFHLNMRKIRLFAVNSYLFSWLRPVSPIIGSARGRFYMLICIPLDGNTSADRYFFCVKKIIKILVYTSDENTVHVEIADVIWITFPHIFVIINILVWKLKIHKYI